MCGIIGYTGTERAVPILLNGLQKLEYRGYDSAGIATIVEDEIIMKKAKGRIDNLRRLVEADVENPSTIGIGHTRWATHGKPSDINSHPHCSMDGKFSVVHNGIIENYVSLKEKMIRKGYHFCSETDTEVVTALLEYYYHGDLLDAVSKTLHAVDGSYALGILCKDYPDRLVAARKDSPLIVGITDTASFIASDVTALIEHTKTVCYLQDRQIAVLSGGTVTLYDDDLEQVELHTKTIDWDIHAAEKGGYEHFMMKEIMEQPKVIRDTIRPRIHNNDIVLDDVDLNALANSSRIVITGCGSAYHAGIVGKYVIEKLARMPVEVDLASEFRYRSPIIDENTLVIAISQSGETADTIAAIKESKELGARTLGIVNVIGSTIANACDDVLYTWAGPEIAVATTKAYSAQLCVLYLIGLALGKEKKTLEPSLFEHYLTQLQKLPDLVEEILGNVDYIKGLASQSFADKNMFFIGRNMDYASALEGSLKLKEISYIHSEAYAAGELKHGTISLIEEGRLVIALACQSTLVDKLMSNIREVKARGAKILSIARSCEAGIEAESDAMMYIPDVDDLFTPTLSAIPMQIFAYYVAVFNGCDIDKPRNLAKSVTVE